MTSIKDVAKAAGVSITTVSFVLNDKGNIPQKTRDHVLNVVKTLGYTRNTSARTLRDKLSRTIGYAKPAAQRPVHPIMDKFLSEVIVQAEQRGWHVLIYASPADDPLAVYQEIISSQRVDGILLASAEQDDPRVAFLHEHNFPFVTLGRSLSALDTCTTWVDVDSKAALTTVTEHLIKAGHTRIGVVAPAKGVVTDLRLAGYAACLDAHNLPLDDSLIIRQGYGDSKDGYVAAQSLLRLERPPTAIISLSDLLAYGVLHYCNEKNTRVALTGFDDDLLADVLELTSVEQPIERAAALLVEQLMLQIQGDMTPVQHLLEAELIVRSSSQIVLD